MINPKLEKLFLAMRFISLLVLSGNDDFILRKAMVRLRGLA
jgi:hypothetical protein